MSSEQKTQSPSSTKEDHYIITLMEDYENHNLDIDSETSRDLFRGRIRLTVFLWYSL